MGASDPIVLALFYVLIAVLGGLGIIAFIIGMRDA